MDTASLAAAAVRTLTSSVPPPAAPVLAVVEHLAAGDPATRAALARVRADPADRAAGATLHARLHASAVRHPPFAADLAQALARALAPPAAAPRTRTGAARGGWLLAGAGLALAVGLAVCGGAVAFLDEGTARFVTTTQVSAGRWRYEVSEAHLRTAARLDGRGPARPGHRYLYLDITVRNLRGDHDAPGIGFRFARAVEAAGGGCRSGYRGDVVAGWCLGAGPSWSDCFETNDTLFRGVDDIPPGEHTQVRCVDRDLVPDGTDLRTIRVYFVGDADLTRIPTRP
jgi:hypothetical protein